MVAGSSPAASANFMNKPKTIYIKVTFPFRATRYGMMLCVHSERSYELKRIRWQRLDGSLRCSRAHFRASRRKRNFGAIHVLHGDLHALMHEIHHAARQAVRMGCVSHKAMSRKSYEERIAVAHGCIGEAVMREWMRLDNGASVA